MDIYKKSLLLIACCCFAFSAAQQLNNVQYNSIESNGYTSQERTSFLMFNNTKAYFFSPYINKNHSSLFKNLQEFKDSPLEAEIVQQTKITDTGIKFIEVKKLTDFHGNTIRYLTKDNVKQKWKIEGEQKNILEFTCQKAVTTFRGRKWIVWFAPSISFAFGPWKLGGLPGLILEAHDTQNMFIYKAESIVLSDDSRLPNKVSKQFQNPNNISISYKEFIPLENRNLKDLKMRIQSMLPKGARTINTDKNNIRKLQPEKSFEWELPKKQNAIDITSLKK